MRQIKFRAWHPETKWVKTHMAYSWKSDSLSQFFSLYEGCVLMQATGLLDRNGKEVYEGDIYTYVNGNAGYGDRSQPDRFIAVINSIEDLYDGDSSLWLNRGDTLVIGNIYDHPELLKAERP